VFRGAQSYEVEIEFTADAAPLVTETTWHHTQEVNQHPDGRVTLLFQVDGLEEILWWVLGWSGRARVIKPNELKVMVVDKLRTALTLNQGY
jgi:predicted DNA-binding transcriptional regulator YafY